MKDRFTKERFITYSWLAYGGVAGYLIADGYSWHNFLYALVVGLGLMTGLVIGDLIVLGMMRLRKRSLA